MNYINEDKNYKTDSEWIKYLEDSIRELRKEKENLKKEKGEIRKRSLELKEEIRFLEKCLDRKEKVNKKLREELEWYKKQYEHTMGED